MNFRIGWLMRMICGIATAIASLMIGGCVLVLPVPNWGVERYGLDSHVVDADTGKPIAGARVLIPSRQIVGPGVMFPAAGATTDQSGAFHIRPHVQFHFGCKVFIDFQPIWPDADGAPYPWVVCSISAPGYHEADFEVSESEKSQWSPVAAHAAGELRDQAVYVTPSLALNKLGKATQPTSTPAQ